MHKVFESKSKCFKCGKEHSVFTETMGTAGIVLYLCECGQENAFVIAHEEAVAVKDTRGVELTKDYLKKHGYKIPRLKVGEDIFFLQYWY